MSAVELIIKMHELRQKKDALEEQLKEVNKEYIDLQQNQVPQAMDAEGISNVRVDGVGRVSLRSDIYLSTPGGKDRMFTWLGDVGLGDIIKTEPTVNASTLKATIRRLMEDGNEDLQEVSEGDDPIFKITPYTQAIITKG